MFDVKNIKRIYFVVLRKIRNFFLGESGKEFLIFLFFLFVSFGFWLLQTMNEVYQTELKIKVRLKDIPKEVVLTSEFPSELSVEVEDRGTVLMNYMIGRTFYPLTFDFSQYSVKGSYVSIPSEEVSKKIAAQLNTTTKLLSVYPDTLGVVYSRGNEKKVPIVLNGKVTADRLYFVSGIAFDPDSVMVYAPKNVLSSITAAYTEPVELEKVSDTVVTKVDLMPIKGVKFVPNTANLSVYTDMYTEKMFEVPVVGTGFPKDKMLRTFPSKVKVSFQVAFKNYKLVRSSDFRIEIPYSSVKDQKSDRLQLSVTSCPDYVSHVKVLPESVDYLIEERMLRVDTTKVSGNDVEENG